MAWSFFTKRGAKVDVPSGTINRPTGAMMPFAGTAAPTGWLLCDGAVVLRASFPDLFSTIGTTYNTGGELGTQFRLPNVDRLVVGANTNRALAAKGGTTTHSHTIPNHSHGISSHHTHTVGSHNHTIPAHTHTLADHSHGAGTLETDDTVLGFRTEAVGSSTSSNYVTRWPHRHVDIFGTSGTFPRDSADNRASSGSNAVTNTSSFTPTNPTGADSLTTTDAGGPGSTDTVNHLPPFRTLSFIIKT